MAGRPRGFETVGDMLRSLAVVGAVVAVILLIANRQGPEQERRVDPDPVVTAAVEVAPFPALVPEATPEGWRPTSARITPPGSDPFSWYVGYLTQEERFVAVTQSDGDRARFLGSVGIEGEPDGTSTVAGRAWERLADGDGLHRSIVLEDGGVVTAVTGTASYEVLEGLAASLREG